MLLSLPLRLSLRGARRALRTTRDVADLGLVALDLVDRALGDEPAVEPFDVAFDDGDPAPATWTAGDNGVVPDLVYVDEPETVDEPSPVVEVPPVVEEPAVPTEEPLPPLDEPAVPQHLDEEIELADSVAEPGAEDGAGAAIRIDPPFPGYDALRAADVIARLADADAATLAAVELYEQTHRGRRTVLQALTRELRRRG